MILAAGMGSRLRPFTDTTPKCLMPLAGQPLMNWTLAWLRNAGVGECIINLHHLADKVREFVGDGSRYGLSVEYSFEPELLGTAGAVKRVAEAFKEPFYVIYADNFSRWDLTNLKEVFDRCRPAGTIAVHWRQDVTQSGMVEFGCDEVITRLVEKPKAEDVTSHYVSAGFFYLDPKVLQYIPEDRFCDFGFHVFPEMLRAGEKLYAVTMEDPVIGIDTVAAYERANALAAAQRNPT